MAQKRMLNKSISLSRQVNKLSLKHKLFFTWAIPHLDDYGLLDNDPEILKAKVCPMVKEITEKDIAEFIEFAQQPDINGESLITLYQDCIEFTGFENHQSISEEKRSKCKFQKIPKNPQENSWENSKPQESPKNTLNNIIEDKLIEDKGREEKITYPISPSLSESWNKTCKSLPQVKELTTKRKEKQKLRLKERNILSWEAIFQKIEASDFCRGLNDRGWKATFDWIIDNADNSVKVLEGKYDNSKKTNQIESAREKFLSKETSICK